jgi:hypothetical protein
MTKKLSKFPYDHVVKVLEQEVWVKCDSAITAMGIGALIKQFYPGYTPKICDQEYLDTMKNQLAN